jgi:hypothetical protein
MDMDMDMDMELELELKLELEKKVEPTAAATTQVTPTTKGSDTSTTTTMQVLQASRPSVYVRNLTEQQKDRLTHFLIFARSFSSQSGHVGSEKHALVSLRRF